jgi:hypothetical protein
MPHAASEAGQRPRVHAVSPHVQAACAIRRQHMKQAAPASSLQLCWLWPEAARPAAAGQAARAAPLTACPTGRRAG